MLATMADTRVQVEVEDWVRTEWMPVRFGEPFYRERLKLDAGGVFDFDAVNGSQSIAAVISTSSSRTRTGKNAVGKMMKIRSDVLFLVMAIVERRVLIVTDQSMSAQLHKEMASGRLPKGLEVFHAELPEELAARLKVAQGIASDEVTK